MKGDDFKTLFKSIEFEYQFNVENLTQQIKDEANNKTISIKDKDKTVALQAQALKELRFL
jgi:hypothetical protein